MIQPDPNPLVGTAPLLDVEEEDLLEEGAAPDDDVLAAADKVPVLVVGNPEVGFAAELNDFVAAVAFPVMTPGP